MDEPWEGSMWCVCVHAHMCHATCTICVLAWVFMYVCAHMCIYNHCACVSIQCLNLAKKTFWQEL